MGGFQYLDNKLQFFPTPEGYVETINGTGFGYVYNYTDHLGNVRLSYAWDEVEKRVKPLESTNYYPFGLKHVGQNETLIKYPTISLNMKVSPGSTGCIDLTNKDFSFFRMLEKSNEHKIRLRVNY